MRLFHSFLHSQSRLPATRISARHASRTRKAFPYLRDEPRRLFPSIEAKTTADIVPTPFAMVHVNSFANQASGPHPDVVTLPSADASALLTLSLTQSLPLLTLSVGDRTVLTGYLSGLPSLFDAHFTLNSVTSPPGKLSQEAIFSASNAGIYLRQAGSSAFHVTISGGTRTAAVEAAFKLGGASWFGLGHLMFQHWPLQSGVLELGPFYPFDNGPNGVCTLIEPTLVSTDGAMVVADDTSRCLHVALNATPTDSDEDPHHFSKPLKWGTGVANFDRMILPREESPDDMGDGVLRLQSRAAYDWPHVKHPWHVGEGEDYLRHEPQLRFSLGGTKNVRTACDAVLEQIKDEMSHEPKTPPPVEMMKFPIWSTWARYKDAVTQKDVLEFAHDIVNRGLPRSVMGIDDRWSVKYGDLDFDKKKFPDPAAMIRELHELGFSVTVWVTPFANTDSNAVQSPESRHFFVHTESGELGEFAWWQPTLVAALDVTNQAACDWFVAGLQRMCDKYGLDGFKFDAGEPSFLPRNSTLEKSMIAPSEYTRTWIHRVAAKFKVAEVRSGVRGCQKAAPMFRLFDKFSTWGLENGLASVMAALLTSGLLGYPFCIPDYIAGNAYGEEVPDAELMIRWAQASAAMPAMQFSIPPWTMGEECERLSETALRWRDEFFWTHVEACMEEAATGYVPIARPMFWENPELDGVADVYDQFMLGKDVVVAPVVRQGQRVRDVFLPSGKWKRVDLNGSGRCDPVVHSGPMWLEGVSAELDDMPTFLRQAES